MPGPVSATSTRQKLSVSAAESTTLPPGGVYLTALSTRLYSASGVQRGSKQAPARPGRTVSATPLAAAAAPASPAACSISASTLPAAGASCKIPVSSRELRIRFSIRKRSFSAWSRSGVRRARWASVRSVSSSRSAYSRMLAIGVRAWCEMSEIRLCTAACSRLSARLAAALPCSSRAMRASSAETAVSS